MIYRAVLLSVLWGVAGLVPAYAQNWEQVYPAWETRGIEDILQWNGDTLYAGGQNGVLLYSVDAGAHWSNIDLNGISLSESCDYVNLVSLASDGRHVYFSASPARPVDPSRPVGWLPEDSLFLAYRFDPIARTVIDISVPRKRVSSGYSEPTLVRCTAGRVWLIESYTSDSSTILHRSSDYGAHWEEIIIPGSAQQFAALSDSGLVCVMERKKSAYLLLSTDAGTTWAAHADTVFVMNSTLYSAASGKRSDGSTYCAIGASVEVLYTTDTGRTWTLSNELRDGSIYFDVKALAVDENDALYVLSRNSGVYRSMTWDAPWVRMKAADQTHAGENYNATDIVCAGNGTITVSTREGPLYRSEDLGSDWKSLHIGDIRDIQFIRFFDSQRGLISTKQPGGVYDIHETTDAGKTWTYAGAETGRIFSDVLWEISDYSALQSYTMEGSGTSTRVVFYTSSNRGRTWDVRNVGNIPGSARGIKAVEGLYISVNQPGDTVWYSTDSGFSWEHSLRPGSVEFPSFALNHVAIVPSGFGPATVYIHPMNDTLKAFYRSDDGCKTWNLVSTFAIQESGRFVTVEIIGRDTIIVTLDMMSNGWKRKYIMSVDAGRNWQTMHESNVTSLNAQPKYYLPAVYLVNFGTAISVCKTENWFGKTDIQFHRESPYVYRAFFLNKAVAWIASGQTIWHTTTGGTVWIEQPFAVRDDAAISSIYPNPVMAGQGAAIEICLPVGAPGAYGNTPLRVSVYDILGRMVATLYNGPADPGTRTLTWQPAATLPAGMYVVRMSLGEKVWAKQVAVVK